MDFNALKEKYKDNEALTADLSQIESAYTTLEANKQNAVDEVKKFKGFKHSVAETIGLDKEVSIDDLQGNLNNKLSEFQQKIDSFKNNASSKEIENANLMEQISNLTNSVKEIENKWKDEQATNSLNVLKDNFRKALNEQRITDPNAVEMTINANLTTAQSSDNLTDLAKSIAEKNPFLTATAHKGGAGSKKYNGESGVKSLSDIDIKDTNARIEAIKAKREAKGK